MSWGDCSFPLTQKVLKHGSATVAFADYCTVLGTSLWDKHHMVLAIQRRVI